MFASAGQVHVTLAGHHGLVTDEAARHLAALESDGPVALARLGNRLGRLPAGHQGRGGKQAFAGFNRVGFNLVHLVNPVHLVRVVVGFCTGCTRFARCTGFRPTYAKSVPNLAELVF